MKEQSIQWLKEKVIDAYKKFGNNRALVTKGRSYTGNEIAEELEAETIFGLQIMNNLVLLTLDLLTRDKLNRWKEYRVMDYDTHPHEYGKYEVYRAVCKKQHYETWNNTSWAYNNNDITHYRKIVSPTE